MAETYDIEITSDGIIQTVYRPGQEPVSQPVMPWVVGGYKTGLVEWEGDRALVVIFERAGVRDESFAVAMDARTVRGLLVDLTVAMDRNIEGPTG